MGVSYMVKKIIIENRTKDYDFYELSNFLQNVIIHYNNYKKTFAGYYKKYSLVYEVIENKKSIRIVFLDRVVKNDI